MRLSDPQATMLLWGFQQGSNCYVKEYDWPTLRDAWERVRPERSMPPSFPMSSRADVLKIVESLVNKGLFIEGTRGSVSDVRRWKITDAGKAEARRRIHDAQRIYYPAS
jgi:hypothetical protein